MDKYLKAIRAARSACSLQILKKALDDIVAAACLAYKAGELEVLDYYRICVEYSEIVKNDNLIVYT